MPSLETQVKAARTLLQTEPINFAKIMLGIPDENLWSGAREMLSSVFNNRRTAVQGANSMSKDWTAGVAVLAWLFKYPFNSKVICTAPTDKQVKEIMFGEIAKQFQNFRDHSPWPVDKNCLTTEKLNLGPEWVALGMTTKETHGMMGKFHGFKSPHMLVIISEAQAVEAPIFDQIYGLLPTSILEIGNPMAPIGRFWEHCTQPRFKYNVIKLNAYDSPNVKAGRVLIPGMATQDFIDDIIQDWGKEHPYYFARVLAEFPQSSMDCVIPMEWIVVAVDRHLKDDNFLSENDDLKVGALDVAKGGDETVHQELTGRIVEFPIATHEPDMSKTVGWAKNLVKEQKLKLYAVDEGGLAGVASFLEEENLPAYKIQFGAIVEDSEDFDNLAARMWWELRKAFESNQISIPNDRVLIGQLAGRKYEYTSRGKRKIKLESKKDAAGRGVESPDRGDALAMAWWARTVMMYSGEGVIGSGDRDAVELQQTIERASSYRTIQEDDLSDIGIGSADSDSAQLDI